MTKIHSISINNFCGIKSLHHRFDNNNLYAFVWRWDSCKSTIIKAIYYSVFPSYNLDVTDTDFYDNNFAEPITIEANFYDLPTELLLENKFWLNTRWISRSSWDIVDDPLTEWDWIPLLTIRLTIQSDLEPLREIISNRQDPVIIRNNDRKKFNVFYISEYLDSHFSLSQWSPFNILFDGQQDSNSIISALRQIKSTIDTSELWDFRQVSEQLKNAIQNLGWEISAAEVLLDNNSFTHKSIKVSLHEHNIPFRLKGKWSKRLISIAIQLELIKNNWWIILIDEFEQGLEPDRIKSMIRSLLVTEKWQFFITTHSSSIVEELETKDILVLQNNDWSIILNKADDNFQTLYRTCPESLYWNKVIVCEWPTEIGICRAIDTLRIKQWKWNFSSIWCVYINWWWQNMVNKTSQLLQLWLDVYLFCDSDIDEKLDPSKTELTQKWAKIIECEVGNCFERQLFKDIPQELLKDVLNILEGHPKQLDAWIKEKYKWSNLQEDQKQWNSLIRDALAEASKHHSWFKNITRWNKLWNIICSELKSLEWTHLHSIISTLFNIS